MTRSITSTVSCTNPRRKDQEQLWILEVQEAVLRFYDKPWDVDRHRDSRASMGRYSRPLMGHAATTHRDQTSYHSRSSAGNKGSYTQEPWEEETFPTEDGYAYNDWDESWQQYPAEEYDDWEEEADLETFLAVESDWIHWDVVDSDVLDSYVEEECSADKSLYEAYLVYKEARDTLNQVRRGRGFWPVLTLLGRPRCCKSIVSQRLVQSSLANLFMSHEVCLWNVSIQEDSVHSCDPLVDEVPTASPSEEDEAMSVWRQEFPEQLRRAIVRIHTNLGHPQ